MSILAKNMRQGPAKVARRCWPIKWMQAHIPDRLLFQVNGVVLLFTSGLWSNTPTPTQPLELLLMQNFDSGWGGRQQYLFIPPIPTFSQLVWGLKPSIFQSKRTSPTFRLQPPTFHYNPSQSQLSPAQPTLTQLPVRAGSGVLWGFAGFNSEQGWMGAACQLDWQLGLTLINFNGSCQGTPGAPTWQVWQTHTCTHTQTCMCTIYKHTFVCHIIHSDVSVYLSLWSLPCLDFSIFMPSAVLERKGERNAL